MHCLGLDQEFQLAKIPVQSLEGTPDGDIKKIYYNYLFFLNININYINLNKLKYIIYNIYILINLYNNYLNVNIYYYNNITIYKF